MQDPSLANHQLDRSIARGRHADIGCEILGKDSMRRDAKSGEHRNQKPRCETVALPLCRRPIRDIHATLPSAASIAALVAMVRGANCPAAAVAGSSLRGSTPISMASF